MSVAIIFTWCQNILESAGTGRVCVGRAYSLYEKRVANRFSAITMHASKVRFLIPQYETLESIRQEENDSFDLVARFASGFRRMTTSFLCYMPASVTFEYLLEIVLIPKHGGFQSSQFPLVVNPFVVVLDESMAMALCFYLVIVRSSILLMGSAQLMIHCVFLNFEPPMKSWVSTSGSPTNQ